MGYIEPTAIANALTCILLGSKIFYEDRSRAMTLKGTAVICLEVSTSLNQVKAHQPISYHITLCKSYMFSTFTFQES